MGATDNEIRLISQLYWYTVEFGLIKENGELKYYGAGIAGSIAEINSVMSLTNIKPLIQMNREDSDTLILEDLQPVFYYIEE